MKKMVFFMLVFIFIIFIGGGLMMIFQNESLDIKTFEVNEYQYYIENFPSEEKLDSVSDTKELLESVERVWIKEYGEQIKKEKPYQVFYDEQNKIWLVCGTLPSNTMGGVANILVEDATGRVLAVWHEK